MTDKELKGFITGEDTLLVEAIQKIDSNANGILFVIDETGALCGVVSDGDIRRWILKTGNLRTGIDQVMNKAPKFIFKGSGKNPYQYMSGLSIRSVPVVDEARHIVDILLLETRENSSTKKTGLEDVPVIIMAGGKGTRLYPYTKILPKPLIPIGEVPIVERIINSFYEYGARKFYMTVNYRKEMIRSYFSDISHDYEICYIEESRPLGTAGSIRLIKEGFERPVVVTNCDTLIRADYKEIYEYHGNSGNDITIVTALKNNVIPYGVVYSKENGAVDYMEEKPKQSYFINTGMYIINPDMISLIPRDSFFHMTHLTEAAIAKGFRVGTYPVSEDSFLDMGEFEEMKRMEEKLNIKNSCQYGEMTDYCRGQEE